MIYGVVLMVVGGVGFGGCGASVDGAAQPPEVADEVLEIGLVVDVEPVPQVAADHHAAETQLPGHADVVDAHATQRVDVAVDEALGRGFFELTQGEVGFFVGKFNAVEDVFQEHILRFFLHCFEL